MNDLSAPRRDAVADEDAGDERRQQGAAQRVSDQHGEQGSDEESAGGRQQDDTLRWLSSATPYARWVGRKGESIPLYDPTNNQRTGKRLNTSPKYEDLPAPDHHVHTDGGETAVVSEPPRPSVVTSLAVETPWKPATSTIMRWASGT